MAISMHCHRHTKVPRASLDFEDSLSAAHTDTSLWFPSEESLMGTMALVYQKSMRTEAVRLDTMQLAAMSRGDCFRQGETRQTREWALPINRYLEVPGEKHLMWSIGL